MLLTLALLVPVLAGNARFNGRWDLTASGPQQRAWWMEISGADTDQPHGRFVSAYNGDMNPIQEITITGDRLQFGFQRPEEDEQGQPRRTSHLIFKARLAGPDKLEGTFQIEGRNEPPLHWTAVRAPVIPDKDDGTWREGTPVSLFNGKDLSGWHAVGGGAPSGWSVENGFLATTGRGNDIVSDQKFWNFRLHVEFKVAPHSNSGVGLRARYEVQIVDDYGRAPNAHSNGALYSRIPPAVNASKPAGEWQTYDIRLVGRQVTVVLNGKKIIDKGEVEGLTAIASDSHEAEPGPVYLQGDHGPVEFRNIVVTPLTR